MSRRLRDYVFFGKLRALVRQINGLDTVKNEGLKPLHSRAKELIAKVGRVEVQYIHGQ